MARVLIVDDERGYRENLERASVRDGHDVRLAGTATEAIEIGARYRPDVLVIDWMLPSSLHGLHVADTLRMVHPDLRTILITGFASPDLRFDAQRSAVTQFLEKPFTLEVFQDSLQQALRSPPGTAPSTDVAVFDIDSAGAIQHATPKAVSAMSATSAGKGAANMTQLLGPHAMAHVGASARGWVTVRPAGEGDISWRLRSRAAAQGDGWLVVVRLIGDPPVENLAAVRMLLNESRMGPVQWPREGHVLVVDAAASTRRLAASALRQVGCTCHSAVDHETAERLVRNDTQIDLVLVNADSNDPAHSPWQPAISLIHTLRRIRANMTFVAVSRFDARDALRPAAVEHVLRTPWGIEDLINSLTGRIGQCVDCGLPIPLRRARTAETPIQWECAGCGARYAAMYDDSAAEDIRGHARMVVRRSE